MWDYDDEDEPEDVTFGEWACAVCFGLALLASGFLAGVL